MHLFAGGGIIVLDCRFRIGVVQHVEVLGHQEPHWPLYNGKLQTLFICIKALPAHITTVPSY